MRNFQSLKGRKIFREVLRKGRRFYGKEIQLIAYCINGSEGFFHNGNAPTLNCLRLGIQIDRKYGNSVKRNLAKRRIRAVCSEILPGAVPPKVDSPKVDSPRVGSPGVVPLEVENNFFVIIRPLEAFKKLKYEDTKKLIELSFKKAGIFRSARL